MFVVGGGPAGLAAAIAARQRGFGVTVADPGRPPMDKACGEGVMPNGVAALRRLGVVIPRAESMPFRGIRFVGDAGSVDALFRGELGHGVRRTVLHRVLIERAEALGVRLTWGTRVRGLAPEGVVLDRGVVTSRWIVGADGQRSQVREWAHLSPATMPHPRFGSRRHFAVPPWTDVVEVYWCEGAQVVVTPVSPAEVCVAILSRAPRVRCDALFDICPALARRLGRAPGTTSERGGISLSCRLSAVSRGRVALIGEASGSLDAITGEGLSMLFQQAEALGEALAVDDLGFYEVAHRRIRRNPALMAWLLVAMDRAPWLRSRGLRMLVSEPALFARLLALHVGRPASVEETVRSVCAVGWRLLTA